MNNYSNTEKSLKRWLKTKVKVTMATVVGFLIAGNVVMGATAEDYKDKQIKLFSPEASISSNKDFFTNISLTVSNENPVTIPGIWAQEGAMVELTGKNIGVAIDSIVTNQTTGIAAKATNKAAGIIKLGNKDTEKVKIEINSKNKVVGMAALGNGNETKGMSLLEVNGKELEVNIISTTEDEEAFTYGISAQNSSTESKNEDRAKVLINSENTIINIDTKNGMGTGLVAMSQGILEVNGNLEVNADRALITRGHAITKINSDDNGKTLGKTVKLDGDIEFNYDYDTSQTTVDADVTLNLSNSESYLNGKISVTGDFSQETDAKKLKVGSMKLGLSNGGTWNVTGDSFVNELTLDGGIINVLKTEETGTSTLAEGISNEYYQGKNDGVTTLNIGNLSGKGGTVTVESGITPSKQLTIQKVNLNIEGTTGNSNPNLQVGLSEVNTDDLAGNGISAKTALKELAGKVTGVGTESIDQTLFVNGGALTGKVTAEVGENGEIVNMQQAKDTPITAAVRDLTGINYLSWKQEMSSLSQRMGELRDSFAEHGVWARVYGGKVENGSQYDNEYQTYQVGYDKKYSVDNGRIYLGYLVSYTDGETDYNYGSGENYSVGAGIYATWMNNNGHYVDVLYKVSRLNNKFDMADVENLKGDYDTYGISLSAEYGKRFDIVEKWFAEPSIGMHLGRLGEETYTTNTGIEISQDSIYTAEGRIGTALGYKFNDKGNVYVRTHVVKEFAGDVDTEYERNGVSAKTSEDFGDTWFEFGIGANYRFAENVNVYADIEKSGDSTVDTKWQGNLGFRYEF